MNERAQSFLCLHLAVFIFGFSALFAKYIEQPALIITLGRSVFAVVFIFAVVSSSSRKIRLDSKADFFRALAAGLFFCGHVAGLFTAVQISTVAIGVITFATLPVFIALLEPVLLKEKLAARTVWCAVITFLGLILTVPWGELEQAPGVQAGLLIGLVATLSYALVTIFNRRLTQKNDPVAVIFCEHAVLAVMAVPVFSLMQPVFSTKDLLGLAVAALTIATVAHILFIEGLKRIRASTTGLIAGLEPVYAIILASLLLGEIPKLNEMAGGLVVVSVAAYMTLQKGK